jgi:geranylgeranyl diphosphate synthase type 3
MFFLFHKFIRVDDIEDNSILRRGIPVAHLIFGVASTINSAKYVYFLGLEKILTLEHPQVLFLVLSRINIYEA